MFYSKFSHVCIFVVFILPFSVFGGFPSHTNFHDLQKKLSLLCTKKIELLGLFLFSSIATYYLLKKSKTGEVRAQKLMKIQIRLIQITVKLLKLQLKLICLVKKMMKIQQKIQLKVKIILSIKQKY